MDYDNVTLIDCVEAFYFEGEVFISNGHITYVMKDGEIVDPFKLSDMPA